MTVNLKALRSRLSGYDGGQIEIFLLYRIGYNNINRMFPRCSRNYNILKYRQSPQVSLKLASNITAFSSSPSIMILAMALDEPRILSYTSFSFMVSNILFGPYIIPLFLSSAVAASFTFTKFTISSTVVNAIPT